MNHAGTIIWFAFNMTMLVCAFAFVQSIGCRKPELWRLVSLGDFILLGIAVRRVNTLLVDVIPDLPSGANTIDRYLWPTVITCAATLLCFECWNHIRPHRENPDV